MDNLEKIVADAKSAFERVADLAHLEQAKARFLGKTGALTEQLKGLGKLPAADRPSAGALINQAKEKVEALLAARREAIQAQSLEARLAQQALDVTLPGRGRGRGSIHPVIRTWQRI
jgi:phenylalanyl-tRNA synthetase alpha chain